MIELLIFRLHLREFADVPGRGSKRVVDSRRLRIRAEILKSALRRSLESHGTERAVTPTSHRLRKSHFRMEPASWSHPCQQPSTSR